MLTLLTPALLLLLSLVTVDRQTEGTSESFLNHLLAAETGRFLVNHLLFRHIDVLAALQVHHVELQQQLQHSRMQTLFQRSVVPVRDLGSDGKVAGVLEFQDVDTHVLFEGSVGTVDEGDVLVLGRRVAGDNVDDGLAGRGGLLTLVHLAECSGKDRGHATGLSVLRGGGEPGDETLLDDALDVSVLHELDETEVIVEGEDLLTEFRGGRGTWTRRRRVALRDRRKGGPSGRRRRRSGVLSAPLAEERTARTGCSCPTGLSSALS